MAIMVMTLMIKVMMKMAIKVLKEMEVILMMVLLMKPCITSITFMKLSI